MGNNPDDHFQMPTPMIKLKSSDGKIFDVEVKVAKLSLHFKEMLDDLGVEENEVISIPQNAPRISGSILEKVVQWANHHKDEPALDEDDDKEVKPMDDISSWDAELLKVDQTTLFQIIRAANYLNIRGLLDVTCKTVAKMMKGMSVEEIRQRFYIQNDFSPDEAKQVRRENAWCEGHSFEQSDDTEMEKIPAHSIQQGDNEAHQVIEDCLSNSVVVRKIFQYFSDTELLKLSYTNKAWNYEARSLMRKRGTLVAHLVHNCCSDDMYQNLQAFGLDLQHMSVVPFSGLSMSLWWCVRDFGRCPTAVLDPSHEAAIKELTLKHFSLDVNGCWWEHKNSPELLLIKTIFDHFSHALESLTIDVESGKEAFLHKVAQSCDFPRLKKLKLREGLSPRDESCINFVKALISRAPNLRELHTVGDIKSSVKLLKGSSAALVYGSPVSAPFGEISGILMSSVRLEHVQLLYNKLEFNFEGFKRFMPFLLEESCATTLRVVQLDAVLALPLMSYGVSFKNVKELVFWIDYSKLDLVEPRILRLVKNFDFTRIFPGLEQVKIHQDYLMVDISPDRLSEIMHETNGILREPPPDRAFNIQALTINSNLSHSSAQFYAEMFPNTRKLVVFNDKADTPIEFFLEHWKNLEQLQIVGKITGNLDSVFCGIFPEEVAELKQKDDEYLKMVNIVPVMPAITCLRKLRTLSLEFCESQDPTLLLTKVTNLIAFARCCTLAVTISTNSKRVWKDTKSYASVTPCQNLDDLSDQSDYDDYDFDFVEDDDADYDYGDGEDED